MQLTTDQVFHVGLVMLWGGCGLTFVGSLICVVSMLAGLNR